MAALKADTDSAMLAIFGDEHKDLIVSSDRAATSATRAKILAAMQTLRVLDEASPDRRVLVIGAQARPVPIPLVRAGDRWRFATEEVRTRSSIAASAATSAMPSSCSVRTSTRNARTPRAIVTATACSSMRRSSRVHRASTTGCTGPPTPRRVKRRVHSGHWSRESAAYLEGHVAGDPYRGYHFRILTRQAKNAPGGAYSYVINGRMLAGFAMVAYPAEYGRSGVMTFIVSHNGKVYEKDLGTGSSAIGASDDDLRSGGRLEGGWTVSDSGSRRGLRRGMARTASGHREMVRGKWGSNPTRRTAIDMVVLQWVPDSSIAGQVREALGVVGMAVDAGCLRSKAGRRQGQAGRRRPATPGGGRRGSRPEDRADLQRVRSPDRRQGNGGDPRQGAGVPRRAALHRGHGGQEGPAAVHARQARVRGEAAAGQERTRDGLGETRQGRNGRAAPETVGRAAGGAAAGLRQRGRQSAHRTRGGLGRASPSVSGRSWTWATARSALRSRA